MSSSLASFLQTLRELPLLTSTQQSQLDSLGSQFPDADSLAQDLISKGWLTAWQLRILRQGRAEQLCLGSYLLLDFLGEGNMGQVYKARQRRLNRLVALKVIHPDTLKNPTSVSRFLREAEAAARLNHPGIVQVYDAEEINGIHYLALEYVDGIDLGNRLADSGPVSIELACNWVRQAAVALQHAHEQGLVHRDIKPSNLMVTRGSGSQPAGAVKILDLGLARLGRSSTWEASAMTLTGAGSPMGTPAYLAPEQAMDAHSADIRADIYSLGCTLYHLLAGRMPFLAENLPQMIAFHLAKEPDPLVGLRAEVSAELWAVVKRMMAKKPEERYQTPGEVAEALAAWTEDPQPHRTTAAAPERGKRQKPAPSKPQEFGTLQPGGEGGSPPPGKRAVIASPVVATRGEASSRTRPGKSPVPPRKRRSLLPLLGFLLIASATGAGWYFWPALSGWYMKYKSGHQLAGKSSTAATSPATEFPGTGAGRQPDVIPPPPPVAAIPPQPIDVPNDRSPQTELVSANQQFTYRAEGVKVTKLDQANGAIWVLNFQGFGANQVRDLLLKPADGNLLVLTDRDLFLLNSQTGEVIFRTAMIGGKKMSLSGDSSEVTVTAENGRRYTFHSNTGKELKHVLGPAIKQP